MALSVGSLFSGIGGIDLGLERAGMGTRWFVEIDPHCRNVLARHWPGLPIYGDITTIDWSGVEPVDVVAGGFPCQPVSNAGKRLGNADARWLWPEFARAIRALRPRYVLVENVAALLGRGFGEVITDLAALGYDAEWDCIPAAAVGAPHLRDRLWIVAYPHTVSDQRAERGEQQQADLRLARTAANAISSQLRVESGRGGGTSWPDQTVTRNDGTPGTVANATGDAGQLLPSQREGLRNESPVDGSARPLVAVTASHGWLEGRPESARQQGRLGAASGGATVPVAVLAGLEGHERGVMALQDFRRSHADPAGSGWWAAEPDVGRVAHGVPHRVDRLRALGNAVVPQAVEWIGRRIVAFDEERVSA